nr:hypothetical protein KKGFGGCE_00001 [Methanosarcinales archaeon ANME-2c ERB4]
MENYLWMKTVNLGDDTGEYGLEFKSRNGSITCRELLGCDISTSEGMKLAEDNGLFITRCPKFVRDAAEIIEQILL